MSDTDITAILNAIRDLKEDLSEVRDEVSTLQEWQTKQVTAAHDRQVRLDAYRGIYRWAVLAWRNDMVKFLLALVLAGGGTRVF